MKFTKKIWTGKPRLSFGSGNVKHEPMGSPLNGSPIRNSPQRNCSESIFVPKSVLTKVTAELRDDTSSTMLQMYFRGADDSMDAADENVPLVRGVYSDDYSDANDFSDSECDTLESNRLFWLDFLNQDVGTTSDAKLTTDAVTGTAMEEPEIRGQEISMLWPPPLGQNEGYQLLEEHENNTPHSMSSMSEDASVNPRRTVMLRSGSGIKRGFGLLRPLSRRASTGEIHSRASTDKPNENQQFSWPTPVSLEKPSNALAVRPASTGHGPYEPYSGVFFLGDEDLKSKSPARKFGTNISNLATSPLNSISAKQKFNTDFNQQFYDTSPFKMPEVVETTPDILPVSIDPVEMEIEPDDESLEGEIPLSASDNADDIVSIGVSSIEHSMVYESEGDDFEYECEAESKTQPIRAEPQTAQLTVGSEFTEVEARPVDNVDDPPDGVGVDKAASANESKPETQIVTYLQAVQEAYAASNYDPCQVPPSPPLDHDEMIDPVQDTLLQPDDCADSIANHEERAIVCQARFGSAYNAWQEVGLLMSSMKRARQDESVNSSGDSKSEMSSPEPKIITNVFAKLRLRADTEGSYTGANGDTDGDTEHTTISGDIDTREGSKQGDEEDGHEDLGASPQVETKRPAFHNLLQQWKEKSMSTSTNQLLPPGLGYQRRCAPKIIPRICANPDDMYESNSTTTVNAVVPFYKPEGNQSYLDKPEPMHGDLPPTKSPSCIRTSALCMCNIVEEQDDNLHPVSEESDAPLIGRSTSDGGDQPSGCCIKDDINNYLSSVTAAVGNDNEGHEVESPSRALVLFENSERLSRKIETPTSFHTPEGTSSGGKVVVFRSPPTDNITRYTEDSFGDDVEECNCMNSSFSGENDHISFFLPQMGMACTCGKSKKGLLNIEDPTAIENILRPWQVQFLKGFGIHRGEQLVKARHRSGPVIAKALKVWRKKHGMSTFKTSSCEMAIHIWSKTCKSFVRSIRKQIRAGIRLLKQPELVMEDLSEFFDEIPPTALRRRPSAKYFDRSERPERRLIIAREFDTESQAEV